MRVVLRPEVVGEIQRAARVDARESRQLGADFLDEVERAFDVIGARPGAGAPMPAGRRRVLLRRFPYAVISRELTPELVRILAVAHLRRRPDDWARRDR